MIKKIFIFSIIFIFLLFNTFIFAFTGNNGQEYPNFPNFLTKNFDTYILLGPNKEGYYSLSCFNSSQYHLGYDTRQNGGKTEHYIALYFNDTNNIDTSAGCVLQVRLPLGSDRYYYGLDYWKDNVYSGYNESSCIQYPDSSSSALEIYKNRGFFDFLTGTITYNREDLLNMIVYSNSNIVDIKTGSNIYEVVEDIYPFLSYESIDSSHVKIYSQWISENEYFNTSVKYAKYYDGFDINNESEWKDVEIETSNESGTTQYRHYIILDNSHNDANGDYYFRFYNNKTGNYKYGNASISFENINQDVENGLLEENNETNKGIWETLKELLSYINPFSENFFVYQLINLLGDLIIKLFIPDTNFFSEWVTNMNNWLSDRLGLLYFPVDLVSNFLVKLGDISEDNDAIIRWDGFSFMGAEIIHSGSYDLNSLLTNNTLKNIHDIYLIFTDIILWICLIFFAKNTFTDIFGGKYDDVSEFAEDVADYGISYDRNKEKARYKASRDLENRRIRYHYYDKKRRGLL